MTLAVTDAPALSHHTPLFDCFSPGTQPFAEALWCRHLPVPLVPGKPGLVSARPAPEFQAPDLGEGGWSRAISRHHGNGGLGHPQSWSWSWSWWA